MQQIFRFYEFCCSLNVKFEVYERIFFVQESNWLKMGKDIRDLMILGNRYNTEIHGKTKLCLIINQVKEEDLGEFTCGIIKSYGTGDSNKHNVDHISLSGIVI